MSYTAEQLFGTLLSPLMTEKSTLIGEKYKQFVFQVRTDANKPLIRAAVEALFKVKVKSVHTANVKGKQKRFAGHEGLRQHWKKAYITLAEGHDINFVGSLSGEK